MQTSGDSGAHLAPTGKKRKRRGKKKAAVKAKRAYFGMQFSEGLRGKHAQMLLGHNAPSELSDLVESSVRTCMSGSGDEGRCHEQAMLGVRNAGWDYDMTNDSWIKGKPRQVTFAEVADGRSVRSYFMPDREIMRPGVWKGRSYPVEMLKQIARDTNAVLGQLRPPMIAEHPEDGRPAKRGAAVGWPKGLYVDANGSLRVKAIKGIPPDAARALEYGSFSDFSVGLRPYTDQETGREYPIVLDHVALTNFPVIKTMEGTGMRYEEAAVLAASEEVEVITFCALPIGGGRGEEEDMAGEKIDAAEIQGMLKAAVAEVAEGFKAEVASLKTGLETQLSEVKAENKALRDGEITRARTTREETARTFVDAMCERGVITKAQRKYEEALAVLLSHVEADDLVTIALSETEKIEVHPLKVYMDAVALRRPEIRIRTESAPRGRGDGEQIPQGYLSETALIAAGHSTEDAKRVVDAANSNALDVNLAPSLARLMGTK